MDNQKPYKYLIGTKLIFLPYLPSMISQYNSWLQDPYIMEMTCTESTTIEEEIQN